MSENPKLALLIDGDNAQSAFIPHIFQELSKLFGKPLVSKVFLDKATIDQWEQVARVYSVEPIWVPNNTPQKNSTDIALVMDAMTLFYERKDITGFCIVTSDSDYTRLARHLKSHGKYVLGIGRKNTPVSFTNACTQFIFVEDLLPSMSIHAASKKQTVAGEVKKFRQAYKHAVELKQGDADGWVSLASMGSVVRQLYPDFDPFVYQNVRSSQLTKVVERMHADHPDLIELKVQSKQPYVRIR